MIFFWWLAGTVLGGIIAESIIIFGGITNVGAAFAIGLFFGLGGSAAGLVFGTKRFDAKW